jgi:hypothetical protein
MVVEILWSNGQRDSAESWDALLDKIRSDQMRPYTEGQFRKELARRARIWSGFRIDHTLPAPMLFKELEYAKVVVILRGRPSKWPKP